MRKILLGLVLLLAPALVSAQPWIGIISSSRAMDWRTAGVEGGIPTTRTNCTTSACITLYGGTVTAASIEAALASAPANTIVRIPAGSYTLSAGFVFDESNVTLRGAGANLTKLTFTGDVGGCSIGANSVVKMCGDGGNIGQTVGGGAGPDNTATWSAGYAYGTATITISNVTNLTVGSTIFLDQINDASDGYPSAGDIYACTEGDYPNYHPCSSEGGGGNYARGAGEANTRAQVTLHKVTAIEAGACAPNCDVTIDPPIYLPNFRSGQSPGAWWGTASSVISGSGIEDLSLDFTGLEEGVQMVNATGCWVRGLRFVYDDTDNSYPLFHLTIINGFRATVQSNYFYGPNLTASNVKYTIQLAVSGSLLIENNIFQHSIGAIIPNGPVHGSAYTYNFVTDSFYIGPGYASHGMTQMNVLEGNNMSAAREDDIHGSHAFETFFRNHFDGHKNNPDALRNSMFQFEANARFMNVVGNVLGDTDYIDTYQTNLVDGDTSVYELGYTYAGAGPTDDSNVKRTLFRWGNWDTKTNAPRWCTDATSPCTESEVPSGITNYPNSVPGSQTLPTSFVYATKPAWFGSVAWPPIGSDVSGGNISGYGGHANKIPARVCYEAGSLDSAYGGSNVKVFNATTCYGEMAATLPTTPTNVRIR